MRQASVFQNLPTSTKLVLLCSAFLIAIVAAIYGIVAEKRIAIEFARKELIGTRYLETLRSAYAAILTEPEALETRLAGALEKAEAESGGALHTQYLSDALADKLRLLWSTAPGDIARDVRLHEALQAARTLALRIGEDSNLTLDPDLDSYYLQDTIVTRLPSLLGHLGELGALDRRDAAPGLPAKSWHSRFLVLDALIRSTLEATADNLRAASRAHPDGSLTRLLGPGIDAMTARTSAYLNAVGGSLTGIASREPKVADQGYRQVADSALEAWTLIQAELDRLLGSRIDRLLDRLYRSLLITGALACLSIAIALMTHRHIVGPLKKLEATTRTVRETRDYRLRAEVSGSDEIGTLAAAFNEMMSELEAARQREAAEQSHNARLRDDLARAARLATMGEMSASIAHEINQPLAAIVANGNAGLRWLAHAVPDLDEARTVLKRIVGEGHRASQVIKSVRAVFRKDGQPRAPLSTNEVIDEVLALVQGELRNQAIVVQTELGADLSPLTADRVQLQQVLLNLINNAAEAMAAVTDRQRALLVRSERHQDGGVLITVADSGPGIDPKDLNRIFEAFFTTKSAGMGMGLSICRSIVEAHGGKLWAEPGAPVGSLFKIALPGKA
jgi:signal transduction histidine kinase